LAGTLVVNTICMAAGVFLAMLYVAHKLQPSDASVLAALYFIVLQFLIVTSLALLFSSFSSPLLSAVFAFAVFVIGSFSGDLREFAGAQTGASHWLAMAAARIIPNLSGLNVISMVAHGEPVAAKLIFANTAYTFFYAAMVLCAAVLIFERRNLK
jgi:Cu-processing system permease protein